jgi:hypothetical protein
MPQRLLRLNGVIDSQLDIRDIIETYALLKIIRKLEIYGDHEAWYDQL